MATKSVPGTIAASQTIRAAIHKASSIHGDAPHPSATQSIRFHCDSPFIRRCFVGDGSDQWRKCSDRYYPVSSSNSIGHSTSGYGSGDDSTASSSGGKKKKVSPISYTSNKRKNESNYYQAPPQPGGLQSLEDIASARLWPVTYLYSSGPPNATDLSNFVDCDKENC